MNLFLDDFRIPRDAFPYTKDTDYLQLEWSIVQNYKEFVKFIEEYYASNQKLPALISFDHDLADVHYEPQFAQTIVVHHEKTGLGCAQWLVDFCLDHELKMPSFKVHSQNPAGGKNIQGLLEQFIALQEKGKI